MLVTTALNYPKGMKPVRSPLLIDSRYRMMGLFGNPVVRLQSGLGWGGKTGSYRLYNESEKYGAIAKNSDEFFALDPVLVEVGPAVMSDMIDSLRGVYDNLEVGAYRMDRDVFIQNASRFALFTGTDTVKHGRTEASLRRAWESLTSAVRRFGEANGIDVDPE
jgi:hypothetical protein